MIDTKALRSRILDLAIQGKLTEQLESDGTAEDMLHSLPKVSAKRAGLLKKNISCNIDYDVPDNWVLAKLGEISSYGDVPNKAVVSECDTNTWILELEEIQAGGKLLTKKRVGNSTSIGEKTHFKAGQVLYSKLRPYLKKVLIADEDGICTPEMIAFDVYADINPNYIVFCLINSYVDKAINDRSYGVKMPRVDAAFMVNLPIPIPPLAEQKRIVQRVEEIFKLLDTIDAAQEKYSADAESLKAKLITAGIQGKLTEHLDSDGTAEELYQQIQEEKQKLIKDGKIKKEKPLPAIKDEELPFEIPGNWKWVRLGSVCQSIMDGDHQPPPQTKEGMPFIVISNISDGSIDFSNTRHVSQDYFDGLSPERIAEQGDILFTVTGSFGIPINVDIVQQFCFQRHIALLKPICHIYTNYLFHVLKSDFIYKQCDNVALGVAQRTVGIKSLRSFLIPLPPLAEQKRIVDVLEGTLGVLG